jgi:hypothetical protein
MFPMDTQKPFTPILPKLLARSPVVDTVLEELARPRLTLAEAADLIEAATGHRPHENSLKIWRNRRREELTISQK